MSVCVYICELISLSLLKAYYYCTRKGMVESFKPQQLYFIAMTLVTIMVMMTMMKTVMMMMVMSITI